MGFLGSLFKKVNPFVGSSLVTGGLGLISGILGADSSAKGAKYSADKSLQATRETNEQNYQLWKEQRQFAIDSWKAENDYNTPAAQRARLEAAGYNPYLAFGDVGNTGGAISQPAATPFQAPSDAAFPNTRGIFAEGINQSFQNALNVLQTAVQMQNVTANTNKTNQETEQSGKMFPWLLDSAKYGSISAKFKSEADGYLPKMTYEDYLSKKRDNYIGELTKDLQAETVDATLKQIKAQTNLIQLNAKAQETLNQYLDQNQQLDLMTKAQTLVNLYQHGELTKQQIKIAVADEILTYAQANGQKLQNDAQKLENQFNEDTYDARVSQQKSTAERMQNEAAASEYLPETANAQMRKNVIDAKTAERTADAIVDNILIESGHTGAPISDFLIRTGKHFGAFARGVGAGIISSLK